MYRHLLVPLDDSDLSVLVTGNAVALARSLGARITFLHAVTAGGSLVGDEEVLRSTSATLYQEVVLGKARELLAKAEAAARALGVPCDGKHVASDRPALAIVEAARAAGCDLIFMASHGHHAKLGMALASGTWSVLMNAGLPVLVSSTGEPPHAAPAIAVILAGHRALAAVMHAWMQALAVSRHVHGAADTTAMRAALGRVQDAALQQHQPMEEQHLFRLLRERTASCRAELDELERQHLRDAELLAELALRVDDLAAAGAAEQLTATQALEEAVHRYAGFLWHHMGRTEGVVLPAMRQFLRPEDWLTVDAASRAER